MEMMKHDRQQQIAALMQRHDLDAILVNNCSLGDLDAWLKDGATSEANGSSDPLSQILENGGAFSGGKMPMHLPFNRSNLCLVRKNGAVEEYSSRAPHPCDQKPFPVFGNTDAAASLHGGRLGLVNPTYLRKVVRDTLDREAVSLVDISDEFHALKAEKTPEECAAMSRAAEVFDRLFTVVPLLLAGEPLEREIVVRLRNRLREFGAECEDLMSSSVVCLTSAPIGGEAVQEPIPYPGRRVRYGDRVNLQLTGYLPGSYCGALGRCYVLGEPDTQTQKLWDLAVSAQNGLAAAAKPGTTIAELMALLETAYLAPNGLPLSTAAQVYGIGMAMSEMPRNVDRTRDTPLQAGTALVIAPLITPEGQDPYCCMDVFQATEAGAKRLNSTSQALCVLD